MQKNKKDVEIDKHSKDEKHSIIKEIIFIAECVFIIFMCPFIYPIVATDLINVGAIEGIEQLNKYFEIFKPFYLLACIIIIGIILHEYDINIPETIKKIFSNINVRIKKGDAELEVNHIENTKELNEKLVQESSEERIKDSKKGVNELFATSIPQKTPEEILEEKLQQSEEKLKDLSVFAVYQVTNDYSRELLKEMSKYKQTKKTEFQKNMYDYYDKKIVNMKAQEKKQLIENKINHLLYNLKYLNIIEFAENDDSIIFTNRGKEFVNIYSHEEVG